ncbi:MAG: cobalamin-dependent protein [Deltaproteobacteria bacterium]|nr:cobalamin-dependent protein [Deltaproteobacteria bacterium]
MDCLFVHCPKFENYYRPIGEYTFVNYMPMGVLALADLLSREGYETAVVHLGVEWIEDKRFSLLDYIAEKKPRIVALSLFWHPQSYEVLEWARRIKEAFPDVFVLLGGMTASYYHREIMEHFPWVDAVIRGEGEVPLLQVTEAVVRGGAFDTIHNLTWRNEGGILENPLDYVASQEIVDGLCFTNFALLKNNRTYIDWVLMPFFVKGFSKERNRLFFSLKSPMLDLMIGRGCPVNCTWCGGGRDAQLLIAGRRKIIFRDIERVIDSIKEALNWGYETMHVCFDPYPRRPDYYLDLFSRIREERLKVEFFFESYGLPTREFIDSFARTFGPRSLLALSPESGSEEVRRRNKGYSYTNQELWKCLEYTKGKEVKVDLFFAIGLPFEHEEDLEETARLIARIRKQFPNVQGIRTFTIEMEPGAPWHLQPERFGIETTLKTFADFYRYHKEEGEGFSAFGYHIPGYFPDLGSERGEEFQQRLQEIKCRRFCFIHPDARKTSSPFWGRMLCRASSLMAKIGKRRRRAKGAHAIT